MFQPDEILIPALREAYVPLALPTEWSDGEALGFLKMKLQEVVLLRAARRWGDREYFTLAPLMGVPVDFKSCPIAGRADTPARRYSSRTHMAMCRADSRGWMSFADAKKDTGLNLSINGIPRPVYGSHHPCDCAILAADELMEIVEQDYKEADEANGGGTTITVTVPRLQMYPEKTWIVIGAVCYVAQTSYGKAGAGK